MKIHLQTIFLEGLLFVFQHFLWNTGCIFWAPSRCVLSSRYVPNTNSSLKAAWLRQMNSRILKQIQIVKLGFYTVP